jgi:hypothetical protein
LPRNATVPLSALIFPFSDAASLISSLESRLANSMSADTVELLKQEHAEELQGLRAAGTWLTWENVIDVGASSSSSPRQWHQKIGLMRGE